MIVKIKRLHPDAVIPKYAHGPSEDAGMDLSSTVYYTLEPGETKNIPTGIAIELPAGFEAQVRPRGGLALKKSITVLNTPGTVDPAYRGEIFVILHNAGKQAFDIKPGNRIAQMIVARYEAVEWEETAELSDTNRGDGAFSSTGISTPLN
jgi:dUTP pyrophosphatase